MIPNFNKVADGSPFLFTVKLTEDILILLFKKYSDMDSTHEIPHLLTLRNGIPVTPK